jgi:hypothetical protein
MRNKSCRLVYHPSQFLGVNSSSVFATSLSSGDPENDRADLLWFSQHLSIQLLLYVSAQNVMNHYQS